MKSFKRSSVVLLVVTGLLGISSMALAEHEEGHAEDTSFSFGYDAENHFFAMNISATDVDPCVLGTDPLATEYTDLGDGLYKVDLETEIEFCSLTGTVVAGPNGQINHGQFMKAALSLFEMKGHGCLVRHLAQSDFGKGETQVKTPDVDTFEVGEGGEITFETFEADCNRGKEGKGRPDSPGKSGEAPRGGR